MRAYLKAVGDYGRSVGCLGGIAAARRLTAGRSTPPRQLWDRVEVAGSGPSFDKGEVSGFPHPSAIRPQLRIPSDKWISGRGANVQCFPAWASRPD